MRGVFMSFVINIELCLLLGCYTLKSRCFTLTGNYKWDEELYRQFIIVSNCIFYTNDRRINHKSIALIRFNIMRAYNSFYA